MQSNALGQVSLFGNLDPASLEELSREFEKIECDPGHVIVREGKPIDSVFIVEEGIVHVRRTVRGKELLLARIEKNGFFGEINLFAEDVATASIHAMNRVKLAKLSYVDFRRFMENNPVAGYQILQFMIKELAKRLRQTNERLSSSVYWSASPLMAEESA